MCDGAEIQMLVPKYLEAWTRMKKNTEFSVKLDAVCECGHMDFYAFKNVIRKTAEQIENEKEYNEFEKRLKWRSSHVGILKDGKSYVYRRNLFGVIVDKVELRESDHTNAVKIKCTKCGNEYIVFDNRLHGHDAITTEEQKCFTCEQMEFEQKTLKKSENNIFGIEIEIIHDIPVEEFTEELNNGSMSIEDYSNAFGSITIYAVLRDLNKKMEIFSEETA